MISCLVILNLNLIKREDPPLEIGPCSFNVVPRVGETLDIERDNVMIRAVVTKVVHRCAADDSASILLHADRIELAPDPRAFPSAHNIQSVTGAVPEPSAK